MENLKQAKKKVKDLIASGRTGEAIQILRDLPESKQIERDIIMISSRYHKAESAKSLNVISSEDYNRDIAQIINSILTLLERLDHHQTTQAYQQEKEPHDTSEQAWEDIFNSGSQQNNSAQDTNTNYTAPPVYQNQQNQANQQATYLSGSWRGQDGLIYNVYHQGNSISIQGYGVGAQGIIQGNIAELQFQMANGNTGSLHLQISPNMRSMAGQSVSFITGMAFPFNLFR